MPLIPAQLKTKINDWWDAMNRVFTATTWVLIGVAIAFLGLRIGFYETDILFEQGQLQNYLVVAMFVLVTFVIIGQYVRDRQTTAAAAGTAPTDSGPKWTDLATGIVTAAAVAALFFGALDRFTPAEQSAAAPACPGALLHNAAAQGQVNSGKDVPLGTQGVNARTGAGSTYEAVNRYLVGCTLGFDGFCIGESITSPVSGIPDTRWLIVHGRDEVVSAALISLQSARDDLGSAPNSRCAHFGGIAGPANLTWKALVDTHHKTTLAAQAPGAVNVGFAVGFTAAQAGGAFRYVQAGAYTSIVGNSIAGTSTALALDYAAAYIAKGIQTVEAVGEACYADDAPIAATARFKQLVFTNGVLTSAHDIPAAADRDRLIAEGCSIR